MIRTPQRKPVCDDRRNRQQQEHGSDIRLPPPPHGQQPDGQQPERRRDPGTGQRKRILGKSPQHPRERSDQIVQRRRGVRPCANGIIFKIVISDRLERMFLEVPHTGHSRITIPIGKIRVPLEKNRLRIPGVGNARDAKHQKQKSSCKKELYRTRG